MDFRFNKGTEINTSDPYYDIFDGGYIHPDEVLEDPEQAQTLADAIALVKAFVDQALEKDVFVEY